MSGIKFEGFLLSVRNAADDDDIGTAYIESADGFSAPSNQINTATAGSDIADETRPGLPNMGDAKLTLFLQMDDPFIAEMEALHISGDIREFTATHPSGTNNTQTFSAFVLDQQITGVVQDVYKLDVMLTLTSTLVSSAV